MSSTISIGENTDKTGYYECLLVDAGSLVEALRPGNCFNAVKMLDSFRRLLENGKSEFVLKEVFLGYSRMSELLDWEYIAERTGFILRAAYRPGPNWLAREVVRRAKDCGILRVLSSNPAVWLALGYIRERMGRWVALYYLRRGCPEWEPEVDEPPVDITTRFRRNVEPNKKGLLHRIGGNLPGLYRPGLIIA